MNKCPTCGHERKESEFRCPECGSCNFKQKGDIHLVCDRRLYLRLDLIGVVSKKQLRNVHEII